MKQDKPANVFLRIFVKSAKISCSSAELSLLKPAIER